MAGMDVGDTTTLGFTVTTDDTAQALGSGSLPVLATPRLLAWCEATTCAVIDPTLEETRTSVGTRVQLEHVAASPVGAEVEVSATIAYVDGRLVRFELVGPSRGGRRAADRPRRGHPGRRRPGPLPVAPQPVRNERKASRVMPSSGDQSRSGSRRKPIRS